MEKDTTENGNAESFDEDSKPTYNMRLTRWRWVTLTLVSILSIGSYFCYDNPSALQT
jgi:hypothetical protein